MRRLEKESALDLKKALLATHFVIGEDPAYV
jgi:hypothetical protein